MKQYYLYVIVVRDDGTTLRQKVCQYSNDIDIKKKIGSYKKILGNSYYIADWYIDA